MAGLSEKATKSHALLLYRAEWAAARAVGELRPVGLVVAEYFATAAVALWPANTGAVELVGDVFFLRIHEALGPLPFSQALRTLQDADAASPRFAAEEVTQALAAEAEAVQLRNKGFYHLAAPLIDQAVTQLRHSHNRLAAVTRL